MQGPEGVQEKARGVIDEEGQDNNGGGTYQSGEEGEWIRVDEVHRARGFIPAERVAEGQGEEGSQRVLMTRAKKFRRTMMGDGGDRGTCLFCT